MTATMLTTEQTHDIRLITTDDVWRALASTTYRNYPTLAAFLEPVQALLMLQLAHRHEHGITSAPIDELATQAGVAYSTASKKLADLARLGWLLCGRGASRRLHYSLNPARIGGVR